MLEISKIREMDDAAILTQIDANQREIFNLNLQKTTAGLEKSHTLKIVRKNIAKLKTVLNERKKKNN